MNAYPPQDEWMRPPKIHEMCRRGDRRRFLLIAEPVRGDCYGVGWEYAETDAYAMGDEIARALELAARRELTNRIERGDKHGEGELWEAFEWKPVIRHEDGYISVAND